MIRVVGLGSPFGDDRVGWQVIESLRGRLPGKVDLVALDRPGAALINWMYGVSWLILVDALSSGSAPGSLIKLSRADLTPETGKLSSHDLSLQNTFDLAKSLGCLPARIDIYGIELGDYRASALSREVTGAADQLATLIGTQLNT